jgi:hypothetical protein
MPIYNPINDTTTVTPPVYLMPPNVAAKLMADWGKMLCGAAEQLEGLAQRQDSQDALESNYKRVSDNLARVVAETEAARTAQKQQLTDFYVATREAVDARRDALAQAEAIAARSRTAAEQHSLEVVAGLEGQRDKLKADVQVLQHERDNLAKNLADMRALIAEMAKQ